MLGWFRRATPEPVAIDAELWRAATASWLFMRGISAADSDKLRTLAGQFLAQKAFAGTHGLEVTLPMQVDIAAQACILVLELGGEWYAGWRDIIVYPSQFAPEREEMDEDGIVHLTRDPMAGEAWLGGPVILSWEDVAMAGDEGARVAGYNVVIHEFAHKLDMRNGEPNGSPPLHDGMDGAAWRRDFTAAYEDFRKRVAEAEDAEEADGGEALDALAIDPYAAESPGEFFAVVSEAFFETPEWLEPEYPAVYRQLAAFYRQDPLARLDAAGYC